MSPEIRAQIQSLANAGPEADGLLLNGLLLRAAQVAREHGFTKYECEGPKFKATIRVRKAKVKS